MTTEW